MSHAQWSPWSCTISCFAWAWKAWAAATWHELRGMRNWNGETWDLFAWMAKVRHTAGATTMRRQLPSSSRRSASTSRQPFSAFVSDYSNVTFFWVGGCWIFFHSSYSGFFFSIPKGWGLHAGAAQSEWVEWALQLSAWPGYLGMNKSLHE